MEASILCHCLKVYSQNIFSLCWKQYNLWSDLNMLLWKLIIIYLWLLHSVMFSSEPHTTSIISVSLKYTAVTCFVILLSNPYIEHKL